MASEVVRTAVSSLLEQKEYQVNTPRNITARETAKTLLEVTSANANLIIFDAFAQKLVDAIRGLFPARAAHLSDRVSGRMMTNFHAFRTEKLGQLWHDLYSKLGWEDAQDPMLEQYASQVVFEKLISSHFGNMTAPKRSGSAIRLTPVEENILRYVSGYVPFKLMKRFEVQTSREAAEYVECLSHMSVGGDITDFPTYAMKWLEQIDRGGLFHVNDKTFSLFRHIESKVRELLPHTLLASAMPASESLSKEALLFQVVEDEDVQSHWSILSVDIEEENNPDRLLRHIVDLWVTIRAHAFTSSWMEEFKLKKHKSSGKQKGIRKTLQGKTVTSKEE